MKGLGESLAFLSVAVTLVASAALIIERVASRIGPRSGSWVAAAALTIVTALVPFAFCPVPASLPWQSSGSSGRSDPSGFHATPTAFAVPGTMSALNAANYAASDPVGRGGFSWQSLSRRLGAGLAWGTDSVRNRHAVIPGDWCILLVAGTCACLVRLVIGLWGVSDCRRRSIVIDEPQVLALVESLRVALGVSRTIEVRELRSPGLSTAAAVGWSRPVILLPACWRNWSESERCVVLAHEAAHIARADYVAGIVARIGLAFHFYHPLVHWLVNRLQLQQELAADADGARLAGGGRVYLLALSRLALGLEKSPMMGPATAFFRTKGHLVRRIEMLKLQVPVKNGTMPAAARAITFALLVMIGVAPVALRGPSQIHGAEALPGADKTDHDLVAKESKASQTQPFDLSYLPPTAAGFVALKPAAISRLPACRAQLERINGIVAKELPGGFPRIEAIEQATVEFSVHPRDKTKKQPGRFMTGAFMMRTVEDFDWKTAIKVCLKKLYKADVNIVEVHLDGQVYFKSTRSNYPKSLGPDSFYLPDARTIVWDFENNLRRLIGQAKRTGPLFVADDWRKVDRGFVAVALDTRDQKWKLDMTTDAPEDLPVAPLLQQPSRWVLGIDGADSLALHALATCDTDAKGQSVARTAETLLARAHVALGQIKQIKTVPKGDPVQLEMEMEEGWTRLANEFVQTSTVHHDGFAVEINAMSRSNVDSLVAFIIASLPL